MASSHASSGPQHPDGLLFATQFSQPALVLMELSAFEDMRANGTSCWLAAKQ